MLLYEYRIVLPFTTSEYNIGQLYSVAELSFRETGGGEGVQVLENRDFKDVQQRLPGFDNGTYTYKIYRMDSKIPRFIRLVSEPGKFDCHEESWNAFPYIKTVIKNPGFMKENFFVEIESVHLDNDIGTTDNALNLDEEELKIRNVVHIDIGNDPFTSRADMQNDPSLFCSRKTGRGPLHGSWKENVRPVMTAYKVVRAEFKWFGLQRKVEHLIQINELRLFTQFHRQVFCWIDSWYGLNLVDIRQMEREVTDKLKTKMRSGAAGSNFSPSDLYESRSSYILRK